MAVRQKSFTFDEPGQQLDGWFMYFQHDYRFWVNNPPLWEYWINLPGTRDAIHFDPASNLYRNADGFTAPVLSYHIPPWLIRRGQIMCLILGVILALLAGRWAWDLGERSGGGLVPAIAATGLICFDPNFLGHAPLVKNDVASALCFLACAYAVWKAGQTLTWGRALAVSLLTATTVLTKFSGPLMEVALVVLFAIRALSPQPWPVVGRIIRDRAAKIAIAACLCLLAGVVAYGAIWASYGFRFNAGPHGLQTDLMSLVTIMRIVPPGVNRNAVADPPFTRLMLAVARRRLLPQ
jgi:hypothetical protein